jgi:hypothetical protein
MTGGWRFSTDASTALRGWDRPSVITGCRPEAYDTDPRDQLALHRLLDGRILFSYRLSTAGSLQLKIYDPATNAWSTTANPVATVGALATAVDSNGRILVMCGTPATAPEWRLYRSIAVGSGDSGWELLAQPSLGLGASTISRRLRLLFLPSGDWALFSITTTAIAQYASADNGSTWSSIGSYSTGANSGASEVVVDPSGAIGMVQVGSSLGAPAYWRTGGAWEQVAGLGGQQIAADKSDAWAAVDPGGQVYVWLRGSAAGSDISEISTYADENSDGEFSSYGLITQIENDADNYPTEGAAAFGLGTAYLMTQCYRPVSLNEDSPIMLLLGGYSTITSLGGIGSGGVLPGGASSQGASWWPIAEPDEFPVWTATGLDGNDILNASGRLVITTTGATRRFEQTPAADTSQQWQTAAWEVSVAAGAGVAEIALVTGGLSTGALGSTWYVNLRSNYFAVGDASGQKIQIVADLTTPMQFRVAFERNVRVEVYYKRPTDTAWALAISFAPFTSAALTTAFLRWGNGNFSAETCVSVWSYLYTYTVEANLVSTIVGNRLSSDPDAVLALKGHPLTGEATPLPVLAATTAGSGRQVVSMRAGDGPAYAGDSWSLPPAYEYPISSLHPTVQPSPRRSWRSAADNVEAKIAWQLPARATVGGYLAVAVLGANVDAVEVYGQAGAGWVLLGAVELGAELAGLTFARTGRLLKFASGAVAPRYLYRGELVGASVDFGGGIVRKIASHTEGLWGGTGKQAELVLDDETGVPASGLLDVWQRQGMVVLPATNLSAVRLRIAPTITADGYYELGTVVIGEPVVAGQSHAWGGTQTYESSAATSTSSDGVPRARRLGPVRRTWSWAWSDGTDQSRLLDADPDPDFLAWSSAPSVPVANVNDAPYLVAGLLSDARSGEVPVVAAEAFGPEPGDTLCDPRLFMLARIASSVGIEHVQGDYEADAVVRVSPLTMLEIV